MEIKKAILHIIDRDAGTLICSQQQLDLEEYAVKLYMTSVINRLENAEYKTGSLNEGSTFCQLIQNGVLHFEEKSSEIAKMIFDSFAISDDAPSGDLLIAEIEDAGNTKLGIFKFNYKPSFTHHVTYEEDKMQNNIILNKAIFPSTASKIEECCLIDLANLTVEIIEKKYQFEDKKCYFFSERFLQINASTTASECLKTIKKTIKEVSNRYSEEEYVNLSQTQQVIYESIEEEGVINNEKIAEVVFSNNESAKKDYLNRIEESFLEKEMPIDLPKYEKKYSKQKFKLANGIEISIPTSIFNDKELIEFINNPDGTISVIIKNVEDVISKF